MNSTIEPLLTLLYFIIKHGEKPYFTTLQPNELICIEHRSIAVQASEVSAELGIL